VTKLPAAVNEITFSPDGRLVAAVGLNHTPGNAPPSTLGELGQAAVWRTSTGGLVWERNHRQGPADSLAFSRDGRRLALSFEVGYAGQEVQIADPASGRVERVLHPTGFAQSLAFAPDGTLATGSWQGIVQRWDVSSGTQVGHQVLAMPAPIANISFTPSGGEFATGGGGSGFSKLWDTQTLQQLGAKLPGSPGLWANAVFTPDGSKLVTLYQDGRGTVWPASISEWETHACRVAGRNFTQEEWSRYVTGRSYSNVC
jgi:WD40 repeat protein